MLIYSDGYEKPKPYKSYKNERFNKIKDKARKLINSINDSSLKKEDKYKLNIEIQKMINDNAFKIK